MSYDYSKLTGRIVEVCKTRRQFASKMGLSEVSLSKKLANKVCFTQDDIEKAKGILRIPDEAIGDYFFTEKVQTD